MPPQVTHPWEGPAHAQDTPGSFAEEETKSLYEDFVARSRYLMQG